MIKINKKKKEGLKSLTFTDVRNLFQMFPLPLKRNETDISRMDR